MIKLFDPLVQKPGDYPIVGKVLSGINIASKVTREELKGIVIFDPSYGNHELVAIATSTENLDGLEIVLKSSIGTTPIRQGERLRGSNGNFGDTYRLADTLGKKFREALYERKALFVPIMGLVEPNDSKLMRGMLEYCVEHARLPK